MYKIKIEKNIQYKLCSFTRLLACGRVSPCFCITSQTMVLRLLLPPPETPEPTALSALPDAFTVTF